MPFGEIVIFSLKFGKLIGGKLGELSHMLIKEHNAFIFSQSHHFIVVIDYGASDQGNDNKRRKSHENRDNATDGGMSNDIAESNSGNGLKGIPDGIAENRKSLRLEDAEQCAAD